MNIKNDCEINGLFRFFRTFVALNQYRGHEVRAIVFLSNDASVCISILLVTSELPPVLEIDLKAIN